MNVLDEVIVLPRPTGPAVLKQTKDDLFTNRVGVVCGFSKGTRDQLVRIKFSDGRYPRDTVWMPRHRLRLYEPPLSVKVGRKARELHGRAKRWLATR